MRKSGLIVGAVVALATGVVVGQQANPRQQPGAMVHIFAPEQHDLYDGHFVMSANRIYMVGGLSDPEGWDGSDPPSAHARGEADDDQGS